MNMKKRWTKEFFSLGLKRPIEDKDLYKTLNFHKSKKIADRLQDLWEQELEKKTPSLNRVLLKIYAARVLIVSLMFTILDCAMRYLLFSSVYMNAH